jgi:hypothetical protein
MLKLLVILFLHIIKKVCLFSEKWVKINLLIIISLSKISVWLTLVKKTTIKALHYYGRGLFLKSKEKNSIEYANLMNSIGVVYLNCGNYAKA